MATGRRDVDTLTTLAGGLARLDRGLEAGDRKSIENAAGGRSLSIETDDFDYTPFQEKGGLMKIYHLFGEQLTRILAELNERLAA